MRLILSLTSLVLATALLASAVAPSASHREFRAKLTGRNEVPAVDTITLGQTRVRFTDDYSKLDIQIHLRDAERITQAHVHFGGPDENGPVILFLAGFHDRGWDIENGPWIRATLTDANIVNTAAGATLREIADSMRAGNTYVNVHSVANPGGEVRGQLRD